MAVDFQDRETFFPSSRLFTQDESSSTESESMLNGFGSCGSSSSGLSTVGSEMSSTKTENDEDDFIADLTRQMAEYMLHEDDENAAPDALSVKPKCSDCNLASKDLHMFTPHKAKPYSAHFKNSTFNQFDELKDQRPMEQQGSVCWGGRGNVYELTQRVKPKQQLHNRIENQVRACGFGNGGRVRPQQQAGSGMRAVFLGKSGSKSGSCGTGVFLPRGTSSTSETQKKSACSTVLIPARVLQTLKLHFDDVSRSSGFGASSAHHLRHDVVMGGGSNDMYSSSQQKQKRQPQSHHYSQIQQQPEIVNDHQEMGLPREWTY
ncbi:uncharacterized protein LOC132269393 [Cornus florida]|uniref:uncharacterized protein LOC132269393 n=1 Tax=Cornus florida TaxID=4283 RepID=UPI00289C1EB4|nr:uncharacterized protein LOC132269393 [Cornus florida]